MLDFVYVASIILLGLEIFHHGILDNVIHFKTYKEKTYFIIFLHELTDLFSLMFFLYVL